MRSVVCVLVAALTAWLLIALFAFTAVRQERAALSRAESWVSTQRLRSLARYHGADALKITTSEVFIRRDRRWIPVWKNPQS